MKKLLIVLGVVVLTITGQAQTPTFDLKMCIDYAIQNNATSQNAQIDKQISDSRTRELRAKYLPQVNAGVDLTHNINVQKIVLENGIFPAFTDPTKPIGEVVAFQLQLNNLLIMSASASQVIYDRSLLAGIHNQDTYKQLSEKQIQRSRIDIIEGVTKAFYGVLVARQQLDFLDKNVNRVDTLFQETQARYKTGIVRKIDVDRIEVRMNNLKEERDKAIKIVDLNLALLKFQMGYSGQDFDVQGTLDESLLAATSSEKDFTYDDRIEYSILKTQNQLNQGELQIIKGGYTPRVSAYATSGYNPAATNLGDIFQGSRYFNYTFVGVRLQIPIFNGFEKRYKVESQLLENRKLENSMHQTERMIDFQVKQAEINLINGMESLKTQKRNLSLAEANVRVVRAENKQGIATNVEVINAETDLKESQNNYYNSLYTAMIAKVDLDKATGKL